MCLCVMPTGRQGKVMKQKMELELQEQSKQHEEALAMLRQEKEQLQQKLTQQKQHQQHKNTTTTTATANNNNNNSNGKSIKQQPSHHHHHKQSHNCGSIAVSMEEILSLWAKVHTPPLRRARIYQAFLDQTLPEYYLQVERNRLLWIRERRALDESSASSYGKELAQLRKALKGMRESERNHLYQVFQVATDGKLRKQQLAAKFFKEGDDKQKLQLSAKAILQVIPASGSFHDLFH